MSRTKPQIVNFYASVLQEAFGFTNTQYEAVRTALVFACSEIEDNAVPAWVEQHNKWVDANNEAVRLKKANEEAEVEIGRLCSKLQEMDAKLLSAATIHLNGTHSTPAAMPAAEVFLQRIPQQVDDQPAIPFDAQAAQEAAAGEAQPDPTAAAPADRKAFNFRWPTLDDKSLEIVRDLDAGKLAWRQVDRDDRRVIVLATIAELQADMPPGQDLVMLEFDRRRPVWMSGWNSQYQAFGRTWTQMWSAALKP